MSMKKTLIITKQLIFNSFSCHLSIQILLQKYKIKQCIHTNFSLSMEAITCLKGFKKTPYWHLVQRSERYSSKKKQIVGEQLTFALENPPLLLLAILVHDMFLNCVTQKYMESINIFKNVRVTLLQSSLRNGTKLFCPR